MNHLLVPLILSLYLLLAAPVCHSTDKISVNCGSSRTAIAARDGREWLGDEFSFLIQVKGSSISSSVVNRKSIVTDDPVPYETARLSHSRFSYTFQVNNNPGQIIIRLHFNPSSYRGFVKSEDLFSVEAGPFTLLSNFSALLTAKALGVSSFVKEFCLNMEENQLQLNLIFSPATSQSLDTYAFINGIEIISVPASLSYFKNRALGVQVVGESLVYIDSNTALEIIRRIINIEQDLNSVSSETILNEKSRNVDNFNWDISVDVGFRYLVRLCLSQFMAKISGVILQVHINEMVFNINMDFQETIDWCRDYLVMMNGNKKEGKRNILIRLQSNDGFLDGHVSLKGFEILKLSNHDNSLASPNPFSPAQDSSYWTIQDFLSQRNMIATVAIALLALLNVIVYALVQIWDTKVKNKPSARAERLCRRFSLAEIQNATGNFSDKFLIGRGGFGNVYKGHIGNERETVAIKRQNSYSSQGAHEFLTEIETLTKVRHVNLVSLIGYCNEHGEMILVYEYMANGTLADHLYKLVRNGDDNCSHLTWKQRLNICIGAGRGLDCLHTGYSLVHRDVKTSNILLDDNFIAKVSDFGLAKHLSRSRFENESHVRTKVKGTFWYLDPNYMTTGKLTRKSDVYAFGVVLFEVLSGRSAADSFVPEDERVLTTWARENINNNDAELIVATDLMGQISKGSLMAFVKIAERCLHYEPQKRPTMAQVVEQLEFAHEQQESSNSTLRITEDGGGSEEIEAPTARQGNVVGFEDEAETIIGYLKEKTQQLDVISIIGMPGLGKTTLAGKIFRDPAIQYEFPTRIWVYISQEFTKKNIFLAILGEFTRITDDMYRKSDQDLARLVASRLERGKFLIVMDDVWTAEDWDKLQIALPKSNMGKVLITSRHMEVAYFANRVRHPHKLRFLTPDESWLLLQLEVFGKPRCPYELEVYGKLIVDQCQCLPLSIVVIGGILAKSFSASDEMSVKSNTWKKVSDKLTARLSDEDGEKRMEKIIALSYDKLPYHLRECFLYFGIFPENFEIPIWKLIRMWIAEGFIQQKVGSTLEETAESYLDDLMNRNLVRVDKKKSDGKPKTCRIHDMLREFCKTEGGNDRENFLLEMKMSSDGGFKPPVSEVQKYRRLCIHSNVLNFISSKPYGPRLRSFACFAKEEIMLAPQSVSDIPDAFKLLRVLEAKPMKFTKLPTNIYQLVHLKYITLSFNLDILPSHFSKLWNLQTLVVETTSLTLDIRADIWKMIQLRHLKTNSSATLVKTVKSGKEGEKLQTLGTISPQSCTEEVFDRARNLKRLGIRGRLALLLEGKSGSFDSLVKLSSLEKLKLLNDVFPFPLSEGKLHGLPQHYKFPPKLKYLTLYETCLDWYHMSILGLLDNLEVLKLKEKAFMGECWEAIEGGFRHLEVLHIGRTNLVVWVASEHHFPRLRRLELKNCDDLLEIPIKLANIPSLELLDVYRSKSAAASAKKIRDAIQTRHKEDQTAKVGVFKLTIFPPDD